MPEDEIHNRRFTKIYLALWGICFFVGAVAFVLYRFGFRLTNRFEPVKVGSVDILSNESGAQIFFDNREKQISFENGVYHVGTVAPGLHSILISKEGFWPWTKTVEVSADTRKTLFAFVFTMDGLLTNVISAGTAEYSDALRSVRQNVAPRVGGESAPFDPDTSFNVWLEKSVPDRKLSRDKSTVLFTEHNTIYLGWVSETDPPPHYFCETNPCKLKMPVTVSSDEVKNVDFYKERADVVLFSAGASIYAIEADREGTQNFQPLYRGVDPYFYENAEGSLYIKDGGTLVKAVL